MVWAAPDSPAVVRPNCPASALARPHRLKFTGQSDVLGSQWIFIHVIRLQRLGRSPDSPVHTLEGKRPINDFVAVAQELSSVHRIVWCTRRQRKAGSFQMKLQRLLGPMGL
jgi:hypothetical protein